MLQEVPPITDGGHNLVTMVRKVMIRRFYEMKIVRPSLPSGINLCIDKRVVWWNGFIIKSMDRQNIGYRGKASTD